MTSCKDHNTFAPSYLYRLKTESRYLKPILFSNECFTLLQKTWTSRFVCCSFLKVKKIEVLLGTSLATIWCALSMQKATTSLFQKMSRLAYSQERTNLYYVFQQFKEHLRWHFQLYRFQWQSHALSNLELTWETHLNKFLSASRIWPKY